MGKSVQVIGYVGGGPVKDDFVLEDAMTRSGFRYGAKVATWAELKAAISRIRELNLSVRYVLISESIEETGEEPVYTYTKDMGQAERWLYGAGASNSRLINRPF